MKKYQIKITDRAFDDMTEIYKYISNNLDSPENALRQYNRIAEAIEKLDFYPARIKLLDSELNIVWDLELYKLTSMLLYLSLIMNL